MEPTEPIVEPVEAAPNADNGNIPVDAVAEPATPVEPTEPVKPTEPELYELPDGRKVDGATLTKEWKENFLPDYTRKSQALAQAKPVETLPETKPTTPLADPNWQPQTYAELIEVAKQAMKSDLVQEEQAKIQAQTNLENAVVAQLEEVKKIEPTLNENALFLHATKYGFRDLVIAHKNMKDMADLAKSIQQTTVKNITKRNDPVSITPGAIGTRSDPSQFSSARDYIRSLK